MEAKEAFMMVYRVLLTMAALLLILSAGCRRDERGQASLHVRTNLPPGIVVALVSVERPGTYVERATTDLSGTLPYIGIRPGVYKLVFQFRASDLIYTSPMYHYGESEPLTIQPGKNHMEWSAGTNKVERMR